jgi:PadR family transcriptional regulator PadR
MRPKDTTPVNAADDGIDLANWTTQLRKGLLELCIVNLLSHGELYAYDLVKRLSELPGIVVSEGTVYPLLSRMRRGGILDTRLEVSAAGPARRYYRLTEQGESTRHLMNFYWQDVIDGVAALQEGKYGNA